MFTRLWCASILFTGVLAVGLLLVAGNEVQAELPKLEPVPDIHGVTVKGQEPRPREIEDAFTECLRAMDEEVRDISDHGSLRRTHINEQTEQCKLGKLACLSAPRGPDCRSFIEDYGV